MVPVIIIVILIIITVQLVQKPDWLVDKGKLGEKMIEGELNTISGDKKIINDIMFNDNGKSRQIDHIAITKQGVFVIETKNYNRPIYGRETSTEWREYIGKKYYTFKNPIHQNYGHLQIVKNILEGITDQVFPIVVFAKRPNLKLKVEVTSPVLKQEELVKYILKQKEVLNTQKIEEIYQILIQNQITDKQTKKLHKENVQYYVQYLDGIAQNGNCPRCGAKLVKRHSKKGEFYGCSNYPKCRYTKNIEPVVENKI